MSNVEIKEGQWGLIIDMKEKRSLLVVPTKDEYTVDEIRTVIFETVHFLATLTGLLERSQELNRALSGPAPDPKDKQFLN